MLTPERKAEYDQRGYVTLERAFEPAVAAAAADRIWTHLAERRGVDREDPIAAPNAGPGPRFVLHRNVHVRDRTDLRPADG